MRTRLGSIPPSSGHEAVIGRIDFGVVTLVATLLIVSIGRGATAEVSPEVCVSDIGEVANAVLAPLKAPDVGELCRQKAVFAGPRNPLRDVELVVDPGKLPKLGSTEFKGLASFYNQPTAVIAQDGNIHQWEAGDPVELGQRTWFVIVGRYVVLALQAGDTARFEDGRIVLQAGHSDAPGIDVRLVGKREAALLDADLADLRYANLWSWMAALAKMVEWSLERIESALGLGWGWSILTFAILLKLLLLPACLFTARAQRRVSMNLARLAPRIEEIKATLDGQKAHECVMATHKELGISPFHTLRPMLGSLVQVPVLVAVFAALGEMPRLAEDGFLWIEAFSRPDAIAALPFGIPGLGETLNLLPLVMFLVTVASTVTYRDVHAPEIEVRRQKRNLYLMALGFLILFYPFPAAMVYYWMIANILQTIQQQLVRV